MPLSATTLDPVSPSAPVRQRPAIPPLQDGDRLDRAEFVRRWDATPRLKRAELVAGVVHLMSPLRLDWHGHPHGRLQGWLSLYAMATAGVEEADNTTVDLDDANQPQPDGLLRIREEYGGQSRLGPDGLLQGAPELAAEVAASTASYDLHEKLDAYQQHGVREYLVWRVLEDAVDWFVLRAGVFAPLSPGADGLLRSEVFPGLWLDPAALVEDDGPRLLTVLQQGLASPEHAAFAAGLARRRQA